MPTADLVVPYKLIRRLAREELPFSAARLECQSMRPAGVAAIRRASRAMADASVGFQRRNQFGQMAGALIVGTYMLGEAFIDDLDAKRVLIRPDADDRFGQALARLSSKLFAARDELLNGLEERTKTYAAIHRIRQDVLQSYPSAPLVLRKRPFAYGKTLIAILNLAFLRGHFGFTAGEDYAPIIGMFNTPEELASAVSTLLAMANDSRPLESIDVTFPMAGLDTGSEFIELMAFGRAMASLTEAEKLVASLRYRLVPIREDETSVYRLQPPFPELEYALRLGFVRSELGNTSSELHVARDGQNNALSIFQAVESFLDSSVVSAAEVVDPETPYRRLRMVIPMIPAMFERLGQMGFYEDLVMRERLAQELEWPLRAQEPSEERALTASLDIETFLRVWRVVQFMNILDITLLRRHQDDVTLLGNSLIRVASHAKHIDLLCAFGLDHAQSEAFMRLMYLDVRLPGHVDVQYRPFLLVNESTLRIGDETKTSPREVVHASSVVAVANVIPNLQRCHSLRVAANADALVQIVAAELRRITPNVKTNVAVALGGDSTDIDVVALAGDVLYMFECKHSLTPTGGHEMRDLWRDIQKGVSQLERAFAILAIRRGDYLAGWFPGTDRATAMKVTLRSCVLCSHRVFSGLTIRNVPIRDHASLALVLGDATVEMGVRGEDDDTRVVRYRLRENERPAVEDLEEYLREDAKYFRMFRPNMSPYSRLDRLTDSTLLTRETFVYQIQPKGWISALEALGARRLADVRVRIGPAALSRRDAAEGTPPVEAV